jgi:hypothetical protein
MGDSVMADPSPENIEGQKVVSHSFDHQMVHQVNWSHVALAVVALIVVYVLFIQGDGADEDSEESPATAASGSPLG